MTLRNQLSDINAILKLQLHECTAYRAEYRCYV